MAVCYVDEDGVSVREVGRDVVSAYGVGRDVVSVGYVSWDLGISLQCG